MLLVGAVGILVLGIGGNAVDVADEAYTILVGVVDYEIADDVVLPVEASVERSRLLADNGVVVYALHVDVLGQATLGA